MDETISEANTQFDRVLGFVPRIDSKASALFAMNTGVLTVGTLNFRASDLGVWYTTVPAVVGLLLTVLSIFTLVGGKDH
ncbi:MAG: hypothetical protein NVV62_01955 [Terricaulis sp.]|nr:hypothetical protein [Terricaulis sp.]